MLVVVVADDGGRPRRPGVPLADAGDVGEPCIMNSDMSVGGQGVRVAALWVFGNPQGGQEWQTPRHQARNRTPNDASKIHPFSRTIRTDRPQMKNTPFPASSQFFLQKSQLLRTLQRISCARQHHQKPVGTPDTATGTAPGDREDQLWTNTRPSARANKSRTCT